MMKRIGIIGAMEIEVNQLKKNMAVTSVKKIAGMEFCEGTYGKTEIVIVRSGIGKVNAAVCTQILVDCYQVSAVINTGIAGGLYNDINIGDIVVATEALQYDMDATGFGYEKGVIPQMPVSVFESDKVLREKAVQLCRKVNPDICVYEGRVISGDCFVSENEKKKELWENFKGYCTEMEGAAIAQTAYLNQIPYLVIRAISDKADGSATVDYNTFEAKAVEHTVHLMDALLTELGK